MAAPRRAANTQEGKLRAVVVVLEKSGGEKQAIVGVPREFLTVLGQDLKRRPPFCHAYIASLANDRLGYLPDRKAFSYQNR